MKRTPLRRVSKNNWWQKLLPKLKRAFARVGITTCERRDKNCAWDNYLGFAHSLRRRFCITPELQAECILCCQFCHQTLDSLKHDETARIIREIIAARPVTVTL